jgi:uncharacterized OB-fold protein
MPRKLPLITSENAAFWQGGASGRLMIQHCGDCGHWFHPPAPVCRKCNSLAVAPRAASGLGHVASFTINYQAWTPELTEPYVVALIELDEQPGLRILSNIVDMSPEQVRIGLPVQARFDLAEDVWLPLFQPRT